jgi:eukaryotic-like serine/threonine-protein kinase
VPFAAGSRLGPYQVIAPLGAGGMGEVYRARDTRLGREVAVKVLPAELSADSNRLRRFEQEARSASALNHPNIVTLHDIGFEGSVSYIAMELVDGKTLRELLLAGSLPIKKLLQIAPQVADGLAKAHEAGIVHRDLKPENVMVTGDGRVKILDFGLAKVTQPDSDSGGSESLTVTRGTEPGIVMGTVGYMSPEQASGHAVDYRSDQFSFGSVLYEMATAKRAFEGKTKPEILAAIIRDEPEPIGSLNPRVPPPVRWIIERCLSKDSRQRYASTEDLARELATVRDHLSETSLSSEVALPETRRRLLRTRKLLGWTIAGALLLAGAVLLSRRPAAAPANRIYASLLPPPGLEFDTQSAPPAISPDGRSVVFRAGDSLWIRSFADREWQKLPGTENGAWPFWSPDSQSIGFITADFKLKRVRVGGTTSQMIVEAPGFRGASWNADDTIIFGKLNGPLQRVPAGGGEATALTKLDPARGEDDHRFPYFLPDGRRFLYLVRTEKAGMNLASGSLDSKETKILGKASSTVAFAPPGYLLSVRADNALVAQPFDARTLALSGSPVSIAEDVVFTGALPAAAFSVSWNGVLVYQSGRWFYPLKCTWLDRSGRQLETFGPTGNGLAPALSPDGTKLVSRIADAESSVYRLWLYEFDRGTNTRLTFDLQNDDCPVWSPDGGQVAFGRPIDGLTQIYVKSTDGSGPEKRLLTSEFIQIPVDWSPDGAFLLYVGSKPKQWDEEKGELWALPMTGERKPFPVAQNVFLTGRSATFSPDGHFVAYTSDESGRFELYVQAFPRATGRWQISKDSGSSPRWRRDGKELFYVSGKNALMSVETRADPTFVASTPRVLFQRKEYDGYMAARRAKSQIPDVGFDVNHDGTRFLEVVPDSEVPKPSVNVVFNWLTFKPKK